MPFMPFYIQELGITDVGKAAQWAGILTGVPAVVMAIFSPIWGSLADIYGRKIMIERAMLGRFSLWLPLLMFISSYFFVFSKLL